MSGLSDLLEGNFSAIGGDLCGTLTKDLEPSAARSALSGLAKE